MVARLHVARTSNNRVISSGDLYFWFLPQCETLCTCRSGFPTATQEINFHAFLMPNKWKWPEMNMYLVLDLNLATFQYIDWFGCYHFCLTRFGLELMIFFSTSSQLFESVLGLQVIVLIRVSQICLDCLLCLFKCWALSMTCETSVLHCLSCRQTYRIGWTFIDPILFLGSSFL